MRAGGAQVTPTIVNRMPASMIAASADDGAGDGDVDPAAAAPRCPRDGAALAPEVAADAEPTGSAAGSATVRSSTAGSFIHAATASLTRGAAQTAMTAPRTERMENAARRAARLWE